MLKHAKIDSMFYELDLHDLPVKKMEISFELHSVIFSFDDWDESSNDYLSLDLKFIEVEHFKTNDSLIDILQAD